MRFLTCLTITIALVAPPQAQTPSAAEVQAKQELDEAAWVYRQGNFVEAQVHSEKALLLDPQNKTALYFVARSIHAQYKPGDTTTGNAAKARAAIIAYQRILERFPDDDESYKAIAFLYGDLKEKELLRNWIFQRAGNTSMANDKRAEAFTVLASKDWECSFQITERPGNKVTTVSRNKAQVSYRMPKDQRDFEQAKECANRGLEMANMATTLAPENETAWSYKTNILVELMKFAEMTGDAQRRRELYVEYEAAFKETTRLAKSSESKP